MIGSFSALIEVWYDDLPDPAYASRWRAGIAAAYCAELRQRAEAAGLLESSTMRAKIQRAEADAQAAAADAQKNP